MALDTLVALVSLLSDGAALASRPGAQLAANAVFAQLAPTRRRAFIEIAVAAVLEDGRVSADEKEWLDERGATTDARAIIDAALAATRDELGSPVDLAKLGSFLAARAAVLGDRETREAALEVAGHLLRRAGHADHAQQTRTFGAALGVSGAVVEDVVSSSERR